MEVEGRRGGVIKKLRTPGNKGINKKIEGNTMKDNSKTGSLGECRQGQEENQRLPTAEFICVPNVMVPGTT